MKRAVLVLLAVTGVALGLMSCGGSSSPNQHKTTGLSQRVAASESVAGNTAAAGVYLLNGTYDTIASEVSGGTNPTIMAVSANRVTLLAANSSTVGPSVEIVDTTTESNVGSISMPGQVTSVVIPGLTTSGEPATGYATVPAAPINGYPTGALEVINVSGKSALSIGVPNAQNVVSDSLGTHLIVFNNDPSSLYVINPANATPPVELGCDLPNPAVCVAVTGFDHPVSAVVSGTTAYILNCGAECGGTQASIQTLDLGTLAVGTPIPVDGATYAMLNGQTLYVVGTSPINNTCSGQTTAATNCGRLDIVDLSTGTPTVTNSIAITDGYHDRMSMGLGNQLFIGSHNCTEIGNVNNPVGEVRGCLTIVNLMNSASPTVIVPPDSGDVTGLQNFTTYGKEYVCQGGNLRVYDTQTDQLLINNILTTGTILINGYVYDVKAIDFF